MADFSLIVDINVDNSYEEMRKDIAFLIKLLESDQPKIKLDLDIDKSYKESITNLKNAIAEINQMMGNKGASTDASGVNKDTAAVNENTTAHNANSAAKRASAAASNDASAANNASAQSTRNADAAEKAYYTTILRMENAIRSWTAAEHSKNSASRASYEAIKTETEALRSVFQAYRSNNASISDLTSATARANKNLKLSERTIRANGDATKSFGDRITNLSAKFSTWFSLSRVIMAAYRAVRQMITNVIELDTAMTELKKVTDETDSTYNKFLDNATNRAKKLGATITDTVNATADFARLGYDIEDSEKLADAAIIYKNVGDGIEDIGTASESIIATMQAFGDEVKPEDVMSIVDRFNEVGNNFAISSKGVGDALLRSAAAMNAANNSLDESIALAAAANTIVQDPEKVGTTLKTVSMYLRAAKTEAEEAGESTDGMATSISKLRSELYHLTGGGVDIQADEDSFKSTYQILKELSEVWGSLTDISQANILEMVGGKRNANVVSALLENFSVAEEALETSANSAGSALSENEKVLESIAGKINVMKASFEELSSNVINSGLVKIIVDILRYFMEFLNLFDGALAKFITLEGAVWGVSKAISAMSGLAIGKAFASAGSLCSALTGNVGKLATTMGGLSVSQNALLVSSTGLGVKQASLLLQAAGINREERIQILQKAGLITATNGQTNSNLKLDLSIKKVTASLLKQAAAWLTTPMGMATAVVTGIVAISSALSWNSKRLEENRQEIMENGKEAAELTNKLSELTKQYQKLGSDGTLSSDDLNTAKSIQEQLVDLIGEEADKVNLVNGKYDEQIKKLREIQVIKAQESTGDIKAAKKAAEESLQEMAAGYIDGGFFGGTHDEQLSIHNFLKDNGFTKYEAPTSPGAVTIDYLGNASAEEIAEGYESLIEMRDVLLSESYEKEIEKGGQLYDFYNELESKIGDMKGAYDKYQEAIGNYNLSEAIKIFNDADEALKNGIAWMTTDGEFSGLTGATIKNAATMETYINMMLRSDKPLKGVKTEIINIAKTAFPEYTKQIEKATKAHIASQAEQLTAQQMIMGETDKLWQFAKQCGITQNDFHDLILETVLFNNKNLEVADKISALQDLGYYARLTAQDIANIASIKRTTVNGKDWLVAYDEDGNLKAIEGVQTFDDKPDKPYVGGVPDYGKNKDSKGSSKNEALDNYLKDAENRYKIHQDETKYIDDLNYALNNFVKTEDERLDVTGKINEAHRDLADNRIKDLEHQIDLTKELKGENADVTAQLTEIQRVAHEEANRLRAMGYDDNSNEIQALQKTWWDAQNQKADWDYENSTNWIEDRNFYNDWEEYGDSEVEAWKRVIAWLEEKYPEEVDKINEARKNLFTAEKEVLDNALDQIDRYTSRITENIEKQSDALDDLISKEEALLKIKEGEYDITNKLNSAQREIDKELRTAKISYEYLDDATRKLIFNEEDYEKLSDTISDIRSESDALTYQFYNKIENLAEDELYLVDTITAEYERQLAMKERELEIAKSEVELQKKRDQLNNVLAEKNIRVFKDGQWQWTYDTDAARQAAEELADVESQIAEQKLQREQQLDLNERQASIDNINAQKGAYEQQIKAIEEATQKVKTAIEEIQNPIQEIGTSVQQLKEEGIDPFKTGLNDLLATIKTITGESYGTRSSGVSSGGGKSSSSGSLKGTMSQGALNIANQYYAKGDTETGDRLVQMAVNARKAGYASGTRSATKGFHEVDEDGEEIYLEDGVWHNFKGGEVVFNAEQTKNLFAMSKLPFSSVLTKMIQDINSSVNIPNIIKNEINNNGNTITGNNIHFHDVRDGMTAWNDILGLAKQKSYTN